MQQHDQQPSIKPTLNDNPSPPCQFLGDKKFLKKNCYRGNPVGRAVTCLSLEQEVFGSNLGPVKSDSVLPMIRHRCEISPKGAVLPGRNDAEMGTANSLHALE